MRRADPVSFTIATCALGRLLLAARQGGICAVLLGDDDSALRLELATILPGVMLRRADHALRPWVNAVKRLVTGFPADQPLPVEVAATEFQRRVWDALRAIPSGQTRSYRDIARKIGRPAAVRAVARACAANPTAVIVPCHRVIRADGNISGYRWGIARKRALLKNERTRR